MTTGPFEEPRRLTRSDDRRNFTSGAEELDVWLRNYAWQNQRANNAVTYVTVRGGAVEGFYALAVAAYAREKSPGDYSKGPTEIPCILLARLAVDKRAAGLGLGAALLSDALRRAQLVSESVGATAFLIHCRDNDARRFYLHNGDFQQSPAEPLHLFISMKQIRTLLGP